MFALKGISVHTVQSHSRLNTSVHLIFCVAVPVSRQGCQHEAKKIFVGNLINKHKSVHHYSSLISLPADNSNSLKHPSLTFRTQIKLDATPEAELSIRAIHLHDAKPHVPFVVLSLSQKLYSVRKLTFLRVSSALKQIYLLCMQNPLKLPVFLGHTYCTSPVFHIFFFHGCKVGHLFSRDFQDTGELWGYCSVTIQWNTEYFTLVCYIML